VKENVFSGNMQNVGSGSWQEKRATSNEQQATSNKQRATSNEQQATSNKQRATSNLNLLFQYLRVI